MAQATVATAVAPQITGKEIAVHTIRTSGAAIHTGFTFMADIAKFATARLVHQVDKTISIQDTDDYISGVTATRQAKWVNHMSGYKPAEKK